MSIPGPLIPAPEDDDPVKRRFFERTSTLLNALVRRLQVIKTASQDWSIASQTITTTTPTSLTGLITGDGSTLGAIALPGTNTTFLRDDGTFTAVPVAGHHASHESGGSDAIKLDDLASPDDNTDLNATSGHHGLLPKLSGNSAEFLDGTGAFSAPSAGGVSDANYGDITVSGSGTVWTVNTGAVDYSELTGVPSTFAPSGHHASHEAGGSDKIKLDDLDTPDDNTDLNATTGHHGLLPKLDSSASKFLDGSGAWSTPSGTGATAAQLLDATRRAFYKPFTTGTDAYEFTGSDLANFTAVNSGSHTVVATEDNDMLSLAHPGGDATAELHAWMKTATINANDYVEAWIEYTGKNSAACSFGVIMSDGHTYGAGTQVFFAAFNTISTTLANHTNFSTAGTSSNNNVSNQWTGGIGIRLQYLGSNNWAGFLSLDGINWQNITGTLSRTMTPTEFGFFCSTWNSANPGIFTLRYCRKGS